MAWQCASEVVVHERAKNLNVLGILLRILLYTQSTVKQKRIDLENRSLSNTKMGVAGTNN